MKAKRRNHWRVTVGAQRVQYLSWIIVGSSSSEGAVVEVEEAELSKAQKRRERQRANRAAAAQRKDLQREKIAKEQFLRETAQGFTERQMPFGTNSIKLQGTKEQTDSSERLC